MARRIQRPLPWLGPVLGVLAAAAAACSVFAGPPTPRPDALSLYVSGSYDWEVPMLSLHGILRLNEPMERETRDTLIVASMGTVNECRGGLYRLFNEGRWSCGHRYPPPDERWWGSLTLSVQSGGLMASYRRCQTVQGRTACEQFEALLAVRES